MAFNYARVAQAAYGDQSQIDSLVSEGWRQMRSIPKSVLFAKGNQLVLGFKGTDVLDPEDLGNDIALALGTEETTARFQQARRWVLTLKRLYPRARLVLTGHSLGGSLLLHCTYSCPNVPGVSYNGYVSSTMVTHGDAATSIASYRRVDMYYVIEDIIGVSAVSLTGPTKHAKIVGELDPHALDNWL